MAFDDVRARDSPCVDMALIVSTEPLSEMPFRSPTLPRSTRDGQLREPLLHRRDERVAAGEELALADRLDGRRRRWSPYDG